MILEDYALLFTKGIGSRGAAHLIDYFGSAEAIFAASRSELVEGARLRAELADNLHSGSNFERAKREVEYCRRNNIIAIAATDEEYPETLREASDRPHVLFVKGSIEALHRRTLAMVGTREATPAGQHSCEVLIKALSERLDDLCIVSGLAYGIDAACHRSAIHNNTSTVAVLANTLPEVSPAPHQSLAEDILRHGGALVSEMHSTAVNNGSAFIARNRIIAGLCQGTIVVESPSTGGSLATAEMADSYGRVVMALPGRISDPASFGTNNLIRTGKARLILTASDILDDMGWSPTRGALDGLDSTHEAPSELTPEQQSLYDAFDSASTLDWPSLMEITGLSMGELSMVAMELELKGVIRSLPGKRYERV